MASKIEIEKIIENIDTIFRGDAWHGPSIMELLRSMPAEKATIKHPLSKYTIAQYVFHLMAWREFVVQKLNNNFHYDLLTDEENWGTIEDVSLENWKNLVIQLQEKQKQLIEQLNQLDDAILNKRVAGLDYDFYKLLTGLAQHDTYHLGMIWVLWE
jgi:DinB superfamily